jgi:hypothetical protein
MLQAHQVLQMVGQSIARFGRLQSPKVRVFAWKLARNRLATQEKNRNHRGLARSTICTICGNEIETGHHAVIGCTKPAAL